MYWFRRLVSGIDFALRNPMDPSMLRDRLERAADELRTRLADAGLSVVDQYGVESTDMVRALIVAWMLDDLAGISEAWGR